VRSDLKMSNMLSPMVGNTNRAKSMKRSRECLQPGTSDTLSESATSATQVVLTGLAHQAVCKCLECPCCMDIKTGGYVECENGHSVCISCVIKMMHVQSSVHASAGMAGDTYRHNQLIPCPQCKIPMNLNRRSRLLESMISILPVCACEYADCPFANTLMTKADANKHSEICEYQRVPCPFRPMSYMCVSKCNKTYKPGELLEHIHESHNDLPSVHESDDAGAVLTMSARFALSIECRSVYIPMKNLRTACPSIILDVLFNTETSFDDFQFGREARLFVLQHLGIMYTVYISLPDSEDDLSITVRGDFPISVKTTPAVRVTTRFSKQSVQRAGKARWIEHNSKLIKNCARFTSLIEDEQPSRLAIQECGIAQDEAYSANTGHVTGVKNLEFMQDFCRPCTDSKCPCTVHFQVRIEFITEMFVV
jgi:hypothetical protein